MSETATATPMTARLNLAGIPGGNGIRLSHGGDLQVLYRLNREGELRQRHPLTG